MYMSHSVKWKILIISLLIPILVGGLSAIIVNNESEVYQNINLPSFAPKGYIFPIVWTILYILMGISFYLVNISDCKNKGNAQYVFSLQLIINFFWPILFFVMSGYEISLIWIIFLDIAVLTMTVLFYKCNKFAGILQIPYLLWCIFATVLTYYVVILNP